MALETRIPKEIRDYKEKIVFGMSTRQLAAVGIAVAVVGMSAFVLWYLLGLNFSVVEYILIAEAMPIIAIGFIKVRGMTFERYLAIMYAHRFGTKHLVSATEPDVCTYAQTPDTTNLKKKEKKKKGRSVNEPTRKEARARRKQKEWTRKS